METNRLSAAQAAKQIADGTLTCERLVRDCLERIAARDGEIGAWAHCDADAAIAQARAIDCAGPKGALAGVPVGFKDVIDTADMPSEYNSPIWRGHRPRADAACVSLVRSAGGIVLGKTVTTEFAWKVPAGTRNPHNPAYSPGGSSSGSAAAVADFMVPLAFGTQTGGSTIRPAAFCGIVGYKPSFGLINRAGLKALAESLDTIGIMARTVEDCALLAHAVSTLPLPDFGALQPPRTGLCRTPRWKDASSDTQALLESTAARLAGKGAPVHEVELPEDFDRPYEDQVLIMNYEGARALAWERLNHPQLLSDDLRSTFATAAVAPREKYDEAMHHARRCRQLLAGCFADCDVLLTPSAPGEAPAGMGSTGSSLFNRTWTLLGVPCVTLPAGRGASGLPLGVQFVAAYDEDRRALAAAEWARRALAN
jgi:Asp-tRNA(Asn)/Glu-tRNA(Gln) amidotransferase A subunit family amidase